MGKTSLDEPQHKNSCFQNARNAVLSIHSEKLLDQSTSHCPVTTEKQAASHNSKGNSTTAGIADSHGQRREHAASIDADERQGYPFLSDFAARAETARMSAMKVTPEQLRLLPLAQAADLWFEEVKKPRLTKAKTIIQYNLYLKNIRESEIGSFLIGQLHHGHLLEYQKQRRQKGLCVSYVNHETNLIKQVLDYCDLWDNIKKHFTQLPAPPWRPPKVLTPEEEDRLLKVASSNPDWAVACCSLNITNNTSAFGVELRTLQLKHIFIDGEWRFSPKIHVPDETAKNQFRARVVPLNEVALKYVRWIVERAKRLGAYLPDHYIFPKRLKRNAWDVTQPGSPSYIRHAFNEMRIAAGLPHMKARYLRNQIITKLFELGTPDETITEIAGHQSIDMSRYYSEIRFGFKKDAVDALVRVKKKKVG